MGSNCVALWVKYDDTSLWISIDGALWFSCINGAKCIKGGYELFFCFLYKPTPLKHLLQEDKGHIY